jgi:hypothetical protein
MTDILISEEEKARFFMGDDAFERADLERKIQELERQLNNKDRIVEATIRKVKDECDREIARIKQERLDAIDQLGKLYEGFSDPEKLEAEDKDGEIRRLQAALLNAKMMITLIHTHMLGSSVEANNLICAIREWANLAIQAETQDVFEQSRLQDNLRELMYVHIKEIFKPHGTNTGVWDKDADPGLHPFGVFVGKHSEDTPSEDTHDEPTTNDNTKVECALFKRMRELRKEPGFVALRKALRKGKANDRSAE